MRRFDHDTVQNGPIYSSIKEEEIFIFWVYFDIFCGLGLVIYEMNLKQVNSIALTNHHHLFPRDVC